jgi:hypothetical protein
MEITNSKYQNTNKHQKPINQFPNSLSAFGFLSFGYWNLFDICLLMIGICEG